MLKSTKLSTIKVKGKGTQFFFVFFAVFVLSFLCRSHVTVFTVEEDFLIFVTVVIKLICSDFFARKEEEGATERFNLISLI